MLYLGGAALLGVAIWQREAIVDFVGKGRQLTDVPVGPGGIVPATPAALAAAAAALLGRPVTAEAYALARMIRSEGATEWRLRGHVAINDAEDLGWMLLRVLTYSTAAWAAGSFGPQFTPAITRTDDEGGLITAREKSVRRYTTSRDPFEADLVHAETVLAEHVAGTDPTGGAVKFVDRSSFGAQAGTGSYQALVDRWAQEGLRPFTVPGYSDDLVVFRRS